LNVLITGATGAVGGQALRLLLAEPSVESVLSLSRRPSGLTHPKLQEVVHANFLDYTALWGELTAIDVCFFALGVSQTEVSEPNAYREITYGYPMALGQALREANPKARFFFVSGSGADRSGRSPLMFARVKGEAESGLEKLYGKELTVFRPAYIHPVLKRDKPLLTDTLMIPFAWLAPWLPRFLRERYFTNSLEVAQAMLAAALGHSQLNLLENLDIIAAARRRAER
jgi:uncharacterized protein YbjT (DUF2867 family)